jgi:TatD DNase family protein
MTFIDIHCHLDFLSKETDIEKVINDCLRKDVKCIISQGVNPESNRKTLAIAEKYDIVKCALGIYPIDALSLTDEEIDSEIEFIRKNKDKIDAIGEVGIDFKESNEKERQKKIFQKFIDLSIEINKVIIVHSRKAEIECIEMLEKSGANKVIMHCFSGKLSLVKRIIEKKWSLSIPTSVKNSEHFQKIIELAPIEQLFCETDSPYLHPDKKWPNSPENVIESYKKIAHLKGLDLLEVRAQIYKNLLQMLKE